MEKNLASHHSHPDRSHTALFTLKTPPYSHSLFTLRVELRRFVLGERVFFGVVAQTTIHTLTVHTRPYSHSKYLPIHTAYWEVFVLGFGVLFLSCVCVCVSVSGVLFSVGVCVCDLLIFLHSGLRCGGLLRASKKNLANHSSHPDRSHTFLFTFTHLPIHTPYSHSGLSCGGSLLASASLWSSLASSARRLSARSARRRGCVSLARGVQTTILSASWWCGRTPSRLAFSLYTILALPIFYVVWQINFTRRPLYWRAGRAVGRVIARKAAFPYAYRILFV